MTIKQAIEEVQESADRLERLVEIETLKNTATGRFRLATIIDRSCDHDNSKADKDENVTACETCYRVIFARYPNLDGSVTIKWSNTTLVDGKLLDAITLKSFNKYQVIAMQLIK